MRTKFIYSLILMSILFYACKKDEDVNETLFFGYQYIPIHEGDERFYQVDSIIYDDFTGLVDTVRFQLLEQVEGIFVNLEGNQAFRTLLFQRKNDTSNWVLQKVFEQRVNSLRYERRMDNQLNIQLVFPIQNDKRWNANALNNLSEEEYYYNSLHESFQLGDKLFDSTVTVIQRREENLIRRKNTQEKYASNYGLVYRYDEDLETDFDGTIQAGYKVTVKLDSISF